MWSNQEKIIECEFPGSKGEHLVQKELNTEKSAHAFYNKQVLDELAPMMREFIATQEMAFISTSDKKGGCDCSFRAGPAGFITVLDSKTIIYPEYRGNGVMASVGNISENPNISILFIDFLKSTVGLHVNGKAQVLKNESAAKELYESGLSADNDNNIRDINSANKIMCYIQLEVEEAYIHCSKHIPRLQKLDKEIHWSTNNETFKGGDAFHVKNHPRPWVYSEKR